MSTPFLSEVRIVSFSFAPKGWALCNGQLLPINQNQALFSLLGTTYGGNGQTNFALPNLQGRAPMHVGNNHVLGESGGEELHTVSASEMPGHSHPLQASSATGRTATPSGNLLGLARGQYAQAPDTTLLPTTIGNTGGGQAHENRPPFLTLNFVIALQGIFPSQN